ncbi:MAG: tRNA adenosine(34) deaminase TadA [Pseudomonadota bacterium]
MGDGAGADVVHTAFMARALAEARLALDHDDVPVGAVVVLDGQVVATGHNRREVDRDPLAHAEILALREASRVLGRWRLTGCALYVTLEPCPMCAGALVHARVDRLVYATPDPRTGACGSLMDLVRDPRLNHRLDVLSGIEAEAAARMLRVFFRDRRRP